MPGPIYLPPSPPEQLVDLTRGWQSLPHVPGPMAPHGQPWVGKRKKRRR